MAYLGSAPTTTASRKSQTTYRYLCTAGQTVFSGADLSNNTLSCDPLDTEVFMNGLKLDSTDTTITTTQVTLAVAAAAGDELEVVAYRTFESADHYTKSAADARYYTQTDADTRYVNTSGDTMTGNLTVSGGAINATGTSNLTNPEADLGLYHSFKNLSSDINTGVGVALGSNNNGGATIYAQRTGANNEHKLGFSVRNNSGSSNTRMAIDGSGRVTKPYQPSFKAHGTTNQYLDATPIEFPSTSGRGGHNIGNHYSTSTDRFTAPVSGRYFFHVHIGIIRIQASTAACYPVLRINQSAVIYSYVKMTGSMPDYCPAHLSAVVNLNASDYVDVTFVGGSNSQYYNGQGELSFQGYLIG